MRYMLTEEEPIELSTWSEIESFLDKYLPKPGPEVKFNPFSRRRYTSTDQKRYGPVGEELIVEPTGPLYRAISTENWEIAKKRGKLSTDLRGAIAENEGMNFAVEPIHAYEYLPKGGTGVVLAINPKGIEFFMITVDDYLRTREDIPLSKVIAVTPEVYRRRK